MATAFIELLSPVECEDAALNVNELDRRLKLLEKKVESRAPRESWYRRSWNLANRHPAIAVIVAILTCIVGLFASPYISHWIEHRDDALDAAIDARIAKSLSNKDGVQDTLQQIRQQTAQTSTTLETIKPFIEDIVRREMEHRASLSQPEFNQSLPSFAHTLAVARVEKTALAPATLEKLNSKLAQSDASAPAYWLAVANLITYRSEASGNFGDENLVSCLGNSLNIDYLSPPPFEDGKIVIELAQHDCVLDLNDKASYQKRVQNFIQASSGQKQLIVRYKLKLKNSTVLYTMGQPTIDIVGLDCSGCRFVVNYAGDAPRGVIRSLTSDILTASNWKSINFQSPYGSPS